MSEKQNAAGVQPAADNVANGIFPTSYITSAAASNDKLQLVLSRLNGLKAQQGGRYMARCPAHDDKTASLSVSRGDKCVLVHCFAGCAPDAILGAINMTLADTYYEPATPKPAARQRPRIVATYDYRDETGRLLYQVVRYAPKDFRQRRPDINGGWVWNLKMIRRVLYRLPELIAADPAATVWITEGEKDVEAARELGLVATCSVGGAGKWRDEYNEHLHGRDVVVIPDNDQPGIDHAHAVAAQLRDVATSVKVLTLPGIPQKGDLSDWLAIDGNDPERLCVLADGALEWTPPAPSPEALHKQAIERWRGGAGGESADTATADSAPTSKNPESEQWPDLDPIVDTLYPVPQMTPAMLPSAMRRWLADIAERLQVPLDFVAVPAIIAAAAVIGNRVTIQPKKFDDWSIVPNLWGAIIGRPGVMKSPSIDAALLPLRRLVKVAEERHAAVARAWEFDKEELEAKRAAIKERMRAAAKSGKDTSEYRAQWEALSGEGQAPTERRYIVNDSTVEKFGELLNLNPRGLMLFRDELTGWLRSLDDEHRANDRTFFLETWNGSGDYTYDRIGRGTLKIKQITTSILGGIQPGPLTAYLRGAMTNGAADDGLMQRFQLLVYPDPPITWTSVDQRPNIDAKNTAFEVYLYLDSIADSAVLKFDDQAQEMFSAWYDQLQVRLRSGAIDHPALEAHFSKYASLMPSLALIFHLCEERQLSPVSLSAATMAAAWCEFLGEHARRVYQMATSQTSSLARTLARKLKAGELGQEFKARELYRRCWTGMTEPKDAWRVLDYLVDLGYLRQVDLASPGGGRPTAMFIINPKIQEVRLD